MPFVLDASVAMAWAFEDEITPYTDRVLSMLGDDMALVPAIWPLEVANAVLGAELRGRVQLADTERFLTLIRTLTIQVDTPHLDRDVGEVVNLARARRLTTFDASYLELAMREGLPLATQDDRLHAAAQQVGVQLLQ